MLQPPAANSGSGSGSDSKILNTGNARNEQKTDKTEKNEEAARRP